MTTHSAEPQTASPAPRRRSPLPWVVAGAVVVVAAVVVALVLTTGDDDGSDGEGDRDRAAAPPATTSGPAQPDTAGYDLRTPEAAARSFAAAAGTGSGDVLLELACVGRLACVQEHAPDLSEAQLTETRDTIREGVFELAEHLEGAEFTPAVDGAAPGTKDVPYRTPAMTGDDRLTLTFVQFEGTWLYHRPAA
jgi:hypothetical protein